jgi:hypothetical protein
MFVHEAVVELFKKQLDLIEEHPYYDFSGAASGPGATQTFTAVGYTQCNFHCIVMLQSYAKLQCSK